MTHRRKSKDVKEVMEKFFKEYPDGSWKQFDNLYPGKACHRSYNRYKIIYGKVKKYHRNKQKKEKELIIKYPDDNKYSRGLLIRLYLIQHPSASCSDFSKEYPEEKVSAQMFNIMRKALIKNKKILI